MVSKTLLTFQIAFVAASGADTYTTHEALTKPGIYEMNPVLGSHPSDLKLAAFEGAWTVGVWAYSTHLWRSGHHKAALGILILGTVLHGAAAVHNSNLEGR